MESIRLAARAERERLIRLLEDCLGLAREKRFAELVTQFTVFAGRFRAHVLVEDEILFPLLEQARGGDCERMTASLRREHSVLLSLCDHIQQSLATASTRGTTGDLLELRAGLRAHAVKEHDFIDVVAQSPAHDDAIRTISSLVGTLK